MSTFDIKNKTSRCGYCGEHSDLRTVALGSRKLQVQCMTCGCRGPGTRGESPAWEAWSDMWSRKQQAITKLIARLRRLNAAYDRTAEKCSTYITNNPHISAFAPDRKRDAFNTRANKLSGDIMRTERRIINALLAEEGK